MSIEKGTRFGLDEVNVPCIYIMRKTLSALEVPIGYKKAEEAHAVMLKT